jgi:hypothetical protein
MIPFSETGKTQIWYMKPETWRMYGETDRKDLSKSHVLLGVVAETNLEKIFRMMQVENWSPHGEARNFIKEKNLVHTSMSVGDIIVLPNGTIMMVDTVGFREITTDG